jgi:tRNA A-37 threonylcarbamoyl transferase component Bud32
LDKFANFWPGGSTMPDDEFESRVLAFEQAWRQNGLPDVADFLDQPYRPDSAERTRLLNELICIDLEFRWRGRSANACPYEQLALDHYAARFPELGPSEQWPLELIGEEYRVRQLWGDRPTQTTFLSRFPARQEAIRSELIRIERDVEAESAQPRHLASPATSSEILEAQAHQNHDGALLSYRDFLLERMIGTGYTGKVYRAWQKSANQAVAVKFLRKSLLHDTRMVHRFIREAATVARLSHPHIVGTYGLGCTPAGAYFIVMDLVVGSDLSHLSATRPISRLDAVRWAVQTCDALAHAHAKQIIHCDLKPANLLIDGDGNIRVTDFGLARSLTEQVPWSAEVEGTAPFMAPEQAARCWGPIDARTDIYGIGAVLFTLLTGRPPWTGRRLPDIVADVISAAPVITAARLRPDLPQPISDLCQKCLSKSPEDRYPTVAAVRTALAAIESELQAADGPCDQSHR